ncbi:MAG TPA: T9SS type A sorting domain-containing protein [Chitinophagaceae bacterium]|nr:T9SS type A sorting domain-containing protein [Chitinophagaceae bacterium]
MTLLVQTPGSKTSCPRSFRVLCSFLVLLVSFKQVPAQTITVDVSQVIKTIAPGAVGINMNYLMDGTHLSPGTQAATGTALKNMKMKLLRYPGGEKSDNFLWSVPPFNGPNHQMALPGPCKFPSRDSRFVNSDFTTVNASVLEFDEFMTMCAEVGADPLIVCAYDAAYYGTAPGSPESNPCGSKPTLQELITTAQEWVRYANITKGYNIKYWSIGNESWNDCNYFGCVSAEQYAEDIVKFVSAMRSVDPSIKIIVNGKGSAWWKTLLESPAAAHIDYFGVSCYPINNFTGGYETYRTTTPNLLDEVEIAATAINQFALPGDKERIKIITTEYNATDFSEIWANTNNVGHALVSFETLGQNLSNPMVEAALFWNTRWINNNTDPKHAFDALDANSALNANGTALSIWGNNILPQLVSSVTTDAGSNFVKTFSLYDNASKKLNLLVINKDNAARDVSINIPGLSGSFLSRYEFKGNGAEDLSPDYTLVNATPQQVNAFPYNVSVARNSISVFQFQQLDFGALPLDILSFHAVLQPAKKVALTWVTGTEGCGNRYTVQRREDGGAWTDLATLNAYCDDKTEYRCIDDLSTSSVTRVFYRIRQTDAQGDEFFSKVSSIVLNRSSNSFAVKIRKQPAEDWLELQVSNGGNTNGMIRIYDLNGRVQKLFQSVPLNENVRLNISDLQKGMYLVDVSNGNARETLRVLKL